MALDDSLDFVHNSVLELGRKNSKRPLTNEQALALGSKVLKRAFVGFCRTERVLSKEDAWMVATEIGLTRTLGEAARWYNIASKMDWICPATSHGYAIKVENVGSSSECVNYRMQTYSTLLS